MLLEPISTPIRFLPSRMFLALDGALLVPAFGFGPGGTRFWLPGFERPEPAFPKGYVQGVTVYRAKMQAFRAAMPTNQPKPSPKPTRMCSRRRRGLRTALHVTQGGREIPRVIPARAASSRANQGTPSNARALDPG